MMILVRRFLLLSAFALQACFTWSGVDKLEEGEIVVPTEVVPPRPAAATSSPGDEGVLHFAGYDVEMIQPGGRWKTAGLNLDGLDTASEDGPRSCVAPRTDYLDGEGGIDNQYGQVVSGMLAFELPTAICEMTGSHYHGIGTFVAGIENWNGLRDDAQVTVWITPAVAAIPTADGEEPDPSRVSWTGIDPGRDFDILLDGEPPPLPCFDGNDVFYLNAHTSTLAPADPNAPDAPRRARIIDTNAYVVDNVIVARVPANQNFTLMSTYRSLPAKVSAAYIVAKLSDDYTHIENSVLAGRFAATDILDIAGEIGACKEGVLKLFHSALSGAVDVMIDPAEDHLGHDCNAISVGIPFKAVRAKVAKELGPEWEPDNHCDLLEEWIDNGELGARRLYGCLTARDTYSFADQWDEEKNPGLMDHCQMPTRTLIPGVFDSTD